MRPPIPGLILPLSSVYPPISLTACGVSAKRNLNLNPIFLSSSYRLYIASKMARFAAGPLFFKNKSASLKFNPVSCFSISSSIAAWYLEVASLICSGVCFLPPVLSKCSLTISSKLTASLLPAATSFAHAAFSLVSSSLYGG